MRKYEHTAAEAPRKKSQFIALATRQRAFLRRCALGDHKLTVMAAVGRIIERIAGLPIVPSRRGGRLAHLLLVVTLKLIHDSRVAQRLRDDKGARLF